MKKNYIKLIGSIICAFSMIMTVTLVAIGAQAEEKEIAYLPDVTCSELQAEPTAPAGYDRASGYLFAGWYIKGGDHANSAGYSSVENPVVGTSYVAKYVPSEVLGVKAQVSGQIVDNDTDKITNDKVNNAIRFVTTLDSTEYNHIGFYIQIEGTNYGQEAATTKYVYKKLYGIGADKETVETYEPKDVFHSDVSVYFKTYTFTNIPKDAFDSDITVTPYWITLDGTRVYGPETAVKTVNYGRAWYYVGDDGSEKNAAAPVGTASNPYTTLAEAINVETKLNPKFILKSDVEIDATVSVARTMTIAGLETADTAKKITYNDKENNMFDVAEGGNLTLDTLKLNGGYIGLNINDGATATIAELEVANTENRGISVDTGGTLTMNGGTIHDIPKSYGVYVAGTATLNNVRVFGVQKNPAVIVDGGGKLSATTLNLVAEEPTDSNKNKTGLLINNGATAEVTGLNVQNTTDKGICVEANGTAKITKLTVASTTGRGVDVVAGGTLTVNGGMIQNIPESYGVNVKGKVTLNDVTIQDVAGNYAIRVEANGELNSDGLKLSGTNSGGINVVGSADTKDANATLNNLTLDATFKSGHGVRAENAYVTITKITKTDNTKYASKFYDLINVSNSATFNVTDADKTIITYNGNITYQ